MLRSVIALGALSLACAGVSPLASAEPKGKSKQKPGRAPAAIGASNVARVQKSWEAAAGGYGRAVALNSGLARVAFGSRDSVEVYDLGTGKHVATPARCNNLVHTGLGFHAGKLFVVCDTAVVSVDARKLAETKPFAIASSRVSAASFQGSRLVLGHRDGVVRVYDLDTGTNIEVPIPGPPIDVKSFALDPSGKRLAVAWVQGSIWWWNTDKPGEPHDLVRHETECDALAFSGDGILAEEGAKNTTTLWALATPASEKGKIKNGDWVKRLHFTRDGKWLARGGSDGLELAEIAGPKRIALDTRSPVEDVAFDELGMRLGAVDRDGRLTIWAVK
jgi:WD40 repeat protein